MSLASLSSLVTLGGGQKGNMGEDEGRAGRCGTKLLVSPALSQFTRKMVMRHTSESECHLA